jgi:hypothetical protein
MSITGAKKVRKWRRYLNIILGISNNKQRKSIETTEFGGDPSSTPRSASTARVPENGLSATSGTNDTGVFLYCAR